MAEWWRGAIIYQVYPRSFCDSNGDGIGDLPGITSRLDYIEALGVDAIWISPFFKSPMRDFGYDVSDFYAVDPIFGCLDDFDELVNQAHSRGLKVIIDQVYSHTSDQCAWFVESSSSRDNDKADWYIWADARADGGPPNNWESAFWGSAWTWDETREQYYMHNFLAQQPDLNLHNPQVHKGLLDASRFWLDRGVDGFRLDATNYFMHDPHLRDNDWFDKDGVRVKAGTPGQKIYSESHPETCNLIRKIRVMMDSYPEKFSVAEIGGEMQQQNTLAYTAGNDHFHTAYNFVFLGADELSASAIRDELSRWNERPDNHPSWAFSNHDMSRVVTRWGKNGDPAHIAKMFQMLLVTLKGTIFLYQGEELGLPQSDVPFDRLQDPEAIANWPDILGRDGARTPIPWSDREQGGGWGSNAWLPIDDRHYDLSVALQSEDKDSTLGFCRQLLAFRKKHPSLVVGDIEFIECPENVLAFVRKQGNEALLCVFNTGREAVCWQASAGEFNPQGSALLSVGDLDPDKPAQLPPLSAYIAALG